MLYVHIDKNKEFFKFSKNNFKTNILEYLFK
jgi:hypothetical protein